MELGEQIATLREEKTLTQVELAEKAKISPSTLSQIESGRVPRPHVGTVRKIARALGVEPAELRKVSPEELAARPKDQAPLSEDLVERSRHIQEARRVVRGEFESHVKALSDDQLRQLADSLGKDLSKGRPDKRLDRLDLWTDPRSQHEEIASRIWTIRATLDVRADTASERDRDDLDALPG
jgi:transcriptional regulator with XRE-family HTH domain